MAHLEYNETAEIKCLRLDANAVTYVGQSDKGPQATTLASAEAMAAFYHSKRNFVLLGVPRQLVFVNQAKVTVLKIVREGDRVAIGPLTFTFRELTREVLKDDSPLVTGAKRCLVDGTGFRAGDNVVYCPSCHTPHHEACWQFQKGRCANGRACQYQAPWDEPEANPA